MTDAELNKRLNKILPKVTSEEFLQAKGLGNEIAFHIFDYPPDQELAIRDQIEFLLDHIARQKPDLKVVHIDLFDFILDYLKQRNLLEKSFEMQLKKGDSFILKHLEKILHPEKLAPVFAEKVRPEEQDLVLVSGVGKVFPLLRTHSLLNNLHPVMGNTPLVMFYPGRYDGQSLRLFGKIKGDNYYRAFKLI